MRRFVTMDETWICHQDSKLIQEQLQWTEKGCSAPKQVKYVKFAKWFWHHFFAMLKEFCETINSEYYCTVLDKFDTKISEKRPDLNKKKIIFHQELSYL